MGKIQIKRILQHTAFWTFYLVISNAYYAPAGKYMEEARYTLAMMPFYLLFTYPQLYLLIPGLLMKKKIIPYVLISLVFSKIVWWLNFLFYNRFVVPAKYGTPVEKFWYSAPWEIHLEGLKSAFAMVMICGVAVSIKLLKKWYLENERNQKIEKEKAVMELEMLKAQVHPHFLFNTLNNLYALSLTHSANAPLVITHLSDLLRYILYECSAREVPLDNELAALKKYIELEKLRYGSRLDISCSFSGDTGGLLIAPLLLLPFVENSFKHGVSQQLEQCWINLHIHAVDSSLVFNLSNSHSVGEKPAATGGIGLKNTQKRLALLYDGKYELHINNYDEMYAVKLVMRLAAPETRFSGKPVSPTQISPATAL